MPEPTKPTQREYWNSKVGEEWAEQADLMDRTLLPLTPPAFAALKLQPGEHVLDIGCGAGATALVAAQQVGATGRVTGIDISQQLLARGRSRAEANGANIDFIEADAGAGAIAGAPFDAAFSRFGVMFFDNPTAAFENIRRNLKPGGRLAFICWRTFAENHWSAAPLAALSPLLKAPVASADPDAPGPFAFADAGKIKTILGAAGWTDLSIAPWDGSFVIGGGGDAREAAAFLLKIGPCARAVSDQGLDRAQVVAALTSFLSQHEGPEGVTLPAACWIVAARA